jgi:hypothetical protein
MDMLYTAAFIFVTGASSKKAKVWPLLQPLQDSCKLYTATALQFSK